MQKITLVLFLLFGLFAVSPGMVHGAEEQKSSPLQMDELTIQVLPEYSHHPKDKKKNQPPLLVGYHGTLRNSTDVPQKGQIEIPLPMKEKNFKIGFVGDYSSDLTEMYEIEYELDKNTGVISWETSEVIQPQSTYKFVIEYYTNSIAESDEKKSASYHFQSFADIGILNIVFVEPLQTKSFKLEPAAQSHQENSFGMNLFSYMNQGVKTGEEKTIAVKYERDTEQTTEEIMEDMAGAHAKQGATVKNDENIPLWKVLSVIGGVFVIAAFLLIFFLKKRAKKPAKKETGLKENVTTDKKAKLRSMLIDGSITQEEYDKLSKRLGGE